MFDWLFGPKFKTAKVRVYAQYGVRTYVVKTDRDGREITRTACRDWASQKGNRWAR